MLPDMLIGIALPGHVRSLKPEDIPDWARAVEDAGFDTFAVSDRAAWSTPEPLTTLAAAAAVTHRVGLFSSVVLAPLRGHPGLFASSAATVDALAGPGRLRLGLAPGGRPSDYVGSPVAFGERGKIFDSWLRDVRATWAGAGLGPVPVTAGGPPLLFGGGSAQTIRRVVAHGVGWVAGGMTPEEFMTFAQRLRTAFTAAGRSGTPRLVVSVMVSLGPERADTGIAAVRDYYADLGQDFVAKAIAHTVTSAGQLRAAIADYRLAGADEVILTPNDLDPDHVGILRACLADEPGR